MNQREKEILIEKLLQPEASDGSALAIVGVGMAIVGAIYKGVTLTAIASAGVGVVIAVTGVAGPACVAISLGGMAYLTIKKLSGKKVEETPKEKERA